MYRSGAIIGVIAVVIAAGATLLSPICAPCAVIFLGLGAGYLAGVFDKPATSSATSRAGAIGGAIGGVGAILGEILGTVINNAAVDPKVAVQMSQGLAQQLANGLGLQVPPEQLSVSTYQNMLVGSAICFSVLDVLLMAGFGALGGLLWWQTTGKNAASGTPALIG